MAGESGASPMPAISSVSTASPESSRSVPEMSDLYRRLLSELSERFGGTIEESNADAIAYAAAALYHEDFEPRLWQEKSAHELLDLFGIPREGVFTEYSLSDRLMYLQRRSGQEQYVSRAHDLLDTLGIPRKDADGEERSIKWRLDQLVESASAPAAAEAGPPEAARDYGAPTAATDNGSAEDGERATASVEAAVAVAAPESAPAEAGDRAPETADAHPNGAAGDGVGGDGVVGDVRGEVDRPSHEEPSVSSDAREEPADPVVVEDELPEEDLEEEPFDEDTFELRTTIRTVLPGDDLATGLAPEGPPEDLSPAPAAAVRAAAARLEAGEGAPAAAPVVAAAKPAAEAEPAAFRETAEDEEGERDPYDLTKDLGVEDEPSTDSQVGEYELTTVDDPDEELVGVVRALEQAAKVEAELSEAPAPVSGGVDLVHLTSTLTSMQAEIVTLREQLVGQSAQIIDLLSAISPQGSGGGGNGGNGGSGGNRASGAPEAPPALPVVGSADLTRELPAIDGDVIAQAEADKEKSLGRRTLRRVLLLVLLVLLALILAGGVVLLGVFSWSELRGQVDKGPVAVLLASL